MMYPLVRELAATRAPVRVPVAVTCRVLGFSTQAYYKWKKKPLSARQEEEQHLISILKVLHEKDPEGGYRVLADDLTDLGYRVSERRVWRLCHIAGIRSTITTRKRKYTVAGPPAHDDLVRRQSRLNTWSFQRARVIGDVFDRIHLGHLNLKELVIDCQVWTLDHDSVTGYVAYRV